MKKVVILEDLGISKEDLSALKAPFEEEGVIFEEYARTTDIGELISESEEADAVILANMPFPDEVINACRNLQFIDVAFTGIDHIGLKAVRERKIHVSNAAGYSNEAVSELVLGMTISMLRNLTAVQERCRTGGTKAGLVGSEIMGKTVGIIGYGRIGRRTGELFHAFGAKILANNRTRHPDIPEYVEQVDLDTLLSRSDIVVLHCPLNETTRGLITYEKLCLMKPTAYMINVARGPVIEEDSLVRALSEGIIQGVGVDVFAKEPPLEADTKILEAPNTFLTPHIAFATQESMKLRADIVFDNLRGWLTGEEKNRVV